MDGGRRFSFSHRNNLASLMLLDYVGVDSGCVPNTAVSEIPKPLTAPTVRGFSLCPHFFFNKQSQRFFDKRRTALHASALLDPVDCLDKFTRNIGTQRHAPSVHLPRPMGGDVLPSPFRISLHTYQ